MIEMRKHKRSWPVCPAINGAFIWHESGIPVKTEYKILVARRFF